MLPGDPIGSLDDFFFCKYLKVCFLIKSMEKVIVMIDAGFLSKISYKLGEGHYFKYDLLQGCWSGKRLCKKITY